LRCGLARLRTIEKKRSPPPGEAEGLIRGFADLHCRHEGDGRSVVVVLAIGVAPRRNASRDGGVPQQPSRRHDTDGGAVGEPVGETVRQPCEHPTTASTDRSGRF